MLKDKKEVEYRHGDECLIHIIVADTAKEERMILRIL